MNDSPPTGPIVPHGASISAPLFNLHLVAQQSLNDPHVAMQQVGGDAFSSIAPPTIPLRRGIGESPMDFFDGFLNPFRVLLDVV